MPTNLTPIDAPLAGTGLLQGTVVVGIDSAGDVAGTYIDTNGMSHGFILPSGGAITAIDAACATGAYQGTVLRAIDAGGDTTGTYTCSGVTHGFVRSFNGATFTSFDALPSGDGTSSFAINSLGAVTGFTGTGQYGFVRNAGSTATTFSVPIPGGNQFDIYPTMGTAINTAGVIAGAYFGTGSVAHGFVRAANGTITTFDPASVATTRAGSSNGIWANGTVPTAIDTAGDIVGSYTDTNNVRHGFLRTAAGAVTPFDAPGAATTPCSSSGVGSVACGTIALGMDDAMDIVGTYFDSNSVACGFLRYGATGAFSTTCATEAGGGAFQGTAFAAVNPSGTVAGTYADLTTMLHGFTYSMPIITTTTTLTPAPTPNPSIYGEPVTFSATIASNGSTPPDGDSVSFILDKYTLGSGSMKSGVASYTTTSVSVGTYSISANFIGDSKYVASTSTAVNQVVNQASSTVALTSSANPSTLGQSVNLTATVSGQFGGWATGSVAFSNGSTSLGSVTLSGSNQAILSTAGLPLGSNSITATYSGDANFTGSASNTLSQVVNPVPNPVPLINTMLPLGCSVGGPAFTLTVNGSGFISSSTVYWGTTALTTTFISATQLTASVTVAQLTGAGTMTVTVQTPTPGGGTSNALQFVVNSTLAPPPAILSLDQAVTAGSPASFTFTLPSTVESATASCLNLPTGVSCSYSATSNTLTITTSSSTPKGNYLITVVFVETVAGVAAGWILLPILLLPLVMLRKKLAARRAWLTACLGLLLLAASAVAITGCGGSSGTTTQQTQQATTSAVVSLTVQ